MKQRIIIALVLLFGVAVISSSQSNISQPSPVGITQVGGATISTAASGVQKVGIVGNGGASVDSVIGNATAPTNQIVTGGVYNSSLPTLTSGQSSARQLNSKGEQLIQVDTTGGNGCHNPNATLTSVYNGATSGTSLTQILALSGTTKIFVCSMSVINTSGTSPTFALSYGTGTACGTGTGSLTFAVPTSTTTPVTFNGPIVGVTPAGNALCYIQTGTTPINKFILTYVQQ
jgi:hypothetical protein